MILLEIQGHTIPDWKSFSSGKFEPRGLNAINCQDVLKSTNLFDKQGLVDSQLQGTVLKVRFRPLVFENVAFFVMLVP